jgi:hypothetical protein
MKFSSCALLAVLAIAGRESSTTEAFSSGRLNLNGRSQLPLSPLFSATVEETMEESSSSSSGGGGTNISAMSRKKEDRLGFMKSKQFHRRGFKEVRGKVENDIQEQFQSELVNTLKTSNYVIERKEEGVKVYLAKDFGFCWGVERSIALAYEAVEHYPDRTLHITNELIHNPEVNDRLAAMKVNMIEKVGNGQKDFSTIKEGDVVILPAFGASYEEMEMLDKKVGISNLLFLGRHGRI